jgi:uncharacterized membrane protein
MQTTGVLSPAVPNTRAYRLQAIDMVRGLVIVIMAIDHVRDFFMVNGAIDPVSDPNVGVPLFATRWITHFCAPVFVLLAGTSAGLMAARRTPGDLARFLFTRGVWLIAVEILIVSTSATFAPGGVPQIGGRVLVTMQVIWAIGASMVALSALQWLGRPVCAGIAVGILAGHNLLDAVWPATSLLEEQWPLWAALHSQMAKGAGPVLFVFLYPLLPWIGVMLLGFGTSAVFELPPARRNTLLLRAGAAATLAFVVLRGLDIYGDPNAWQQGSSLTRTTIDFLNTTKYPPSLLFLLMTIGPATVLCAFSDRFTGRLSGILMTFGRVPFAFYVAHVLLIHALSVGLGVIQGFDASQLMTLFTFYPQGFGLPLAGVYAVWLLVITLLYPFCRWVAAVKARRRDWWLSYV